MGGGAVIAAAAAARRRRMQQVIDTFRLAGATAPERARGIDALAIDANAEFDALARDGILVQLTRDDRWYLDEAAYVQWRDRSNSRGALVVLVVVLLVAAVALVLAIRSTNAR